MEILKLLRDNDFKFKKSLGQNFITDTSLLRAIVSDSLITEKDTVVEIGTGAGTLTKELAKVAKKVVTFEVDSSLSCVLGEYLGKDKNVEIVYSDVLKMSDKELSFLIGERFKVVANLPYYITSPLIMRFLESSLEVESITVTVQKEVGERLVAPANTKEYGAITLQVGLRGQAKIVRQINRKAFTPVPNVDSVVLRIDVDRDKYDKVLTEKVSKLVRIAFSMRRKTLINNLSAGYAVSKERIKEILESLGLSPSIRGEALSLEDYIRIAKRF